MDKRFLRGLMTGNTRSWGQSQWRRWEWLKCSCKDVGFEIEERLAKEYVNDKKRHEMHQHFRRVTRKRSYGESRCNTLYLDHFHYFTVEAEIEVNFKVKLDTPSQFMRDLQKMIDYMTNVVGLELKNSLHVNLLYKRIHYDYFICVATRKAYTKSFDSNYLRYESKNALATKLVHDWMYQTYINLFILGSYVRKNNILMNKYPKYKYYLIQEYVNGKYIRFDETVGAKQAKFFRRNKADKKIVGDAVHLFDKQLREATPEHIELFLVKNDKILNHQSNWIVL